MKGLPHAYRSAALAIALLAACWSAPGMTHPAPPPGSCEVSHGEKLPRASGGGTALCAAIAQAASARGLAATFAVRVSVGPKSQLSAEITLANGRSLPPLRMAEMDRPIGPSSFARFASAIADHIAGAHH
jgi:hypothetical protein